MVDQILKSFLPFKYPIMRKYLVSVVYSPIRDFDIAKAEPLAEAVVFVNKKCF